MFGNESALKVYTMNGVDPERTYKSRHFMIHQQLPNLSGYDIQKTLESIDEDLACLKGEIAECESAIRQVKQGADPEDVRRKFNVTWLLSASKKDIILQFKQVITERKSTAKIVRREKAIYLREKYLRKLAAAQLPFIRLKLQGLSKEASDALSKMRSRLEQVDQLCNLYAGVSCEIGELQTKVRKFSFDSVETLETMNSPPSLPPYMKDTNKQFLEALK